MTFELVNTSNIPILLYLTLLIHEGHLTCLFITPKNVSINFHHAVVWPSKH